MASPSLSPPPTADRKTQHAPPRVRRRNRLITSCLECRRRKLKCDKNSPCANCTRISRPCVFIASGLDAEAQARLAEVKEKMGMLERSLEAGVALNSRATPDEKSDTMRLPSTLPGQSESYSDQEDDEDTFTLDPSVYATEDAAYYEDDANDDVVDLGIALGKVRITDRIGGLVRPRFSEELLHALNEVPKFGRKSPDPVSLHDPQDCLTPNRDYVAPASTFFFVPGMEKVSLMTYLPTKTLADKLMAHYWEAVHVIARTVHRPTFERNYDQLWANIDARVETRTSFQAVILAAMLSSVISMSDTKVLTDFGVDKQSLVDNFRQGTEAALSKANFLRSTRLETLQAFVMYLIPLCRNNISRAHSALTGTCIRLAECMGLHRDPTNYSNSPIEIHVRRLVWFQICFLDLRTSEATGPRPQIRSDDYDTQFPLNIDDVDLDRAEYGDQRIDVSKDRTYFTDMTITRMRFECYEMHRLMWSERPKLEKRRPDGERKVTLTSLLSRVQSFKEAMEKTYVPMLNNTVPLHVLASEIYSIISDRLYIFLLQKYLSSDRSKMPDRLRQVVISASILTIEHAINIEEQPALATWSWYIGALQQYHVALLLLSEVHAGSNEPEVEDRAWRCMDFAFGLSPDEERPDKARFILEDLIAKTKWYSSLKKLRVPTNMPPAGPRKHTPGFIARQREEREHEEKLKQSAEKYVSDSSPMTQIPPSPPQPSSQPYYHRPHSQTHLSAETIGFPGAVPNVDWGTIDMPISTHPMPPPPPIIEPYSFDPLYSSPSTSFIPPPPTTTTYHAHSAMYAGIPQSNLHAGKPGSSPDALNEIDWNDIEKMFGDREMESGMFIPPYAFPQFKPGDLSWGNP